MHLKQHPRTPRVLFILRLRAGFHPEGAFLQTRRNCVAVAAFGAKTRRAVDARDKVLQSLAWFLQASLSRALGGRTRRPTHGPVQTLRSRLEALPVLPVASASTSLANIRASQLPRLREPQLLLARTRKAPPPTFGAATVGLPCDCQVSSRSLFRPRFLTVPARVLNRRVVRPVLATATLGVHFRAPPRPLPSHVAPLRRFQLTQGTRHRRPGLFARRTTSSHSAAGLIVTQRRDRPWLSQVPMPWLDLVARPSAGGDSFLSAVSAHVDVYPAAEAPAARASCCGCFGRKKRTPREETEDALRRVPGLDTEVYVVTSGTVAQTHRAGAAGSKGKGLQRTFSGMGGAQDVELAPQAIPGTAVPVSVDVGQGHHAIMTSGAKGIMGMTLYDFGIYADMHEVHGSALGARYREKGITAPHDAMHEDILAEGDFPLTVTLCVARTVKAGLIQGIYKGIFERRTVKAGGTKDDPALQQIINVFDPAKMSRIPGVLDGQSVLKGTVLSFTRSKDRQKLKVCVNGTLLDTIESPTVARAFIDIYVGTQPTTEDSQQAAWRSLVRMMNSPPAALGHPHSPRKGHNLPAVGYREPSGSRK